MVIRAESGAIWSSEINGFLVSIRLEIGNVLLSLLQSIDKHFLNARISKLRSLFARLNSFLLNPQGVQLTA
ncbi:hypothetical protein C404_05400 [Ralstonia sp. AU12-08]|nr:hypothetical protein C404_05400 [Ralstonia sp. AU12-08]